MGLVRSLVKKVAGRVLGRDAAPSAPTPVMRNVFRAMPPCRGKF